VEERRKFHRIPFQCECQVHCGERVWSGELLDISLRGVLFRLSETVLLDKGSICYVDIVLAGSDIRLQFESELVHQQGDRHGFRFLSENLETLTHLRRLLELNTGEDESTRHEIEVWLED